MPRFPFKQVDVFTKADQGCRFRGNPVAVIFDLQGQLEAEQMQLIANWTNLSETTFAVPKTAGTGNEGTAADYRVRIFTPQAELPFAGHPTIGTAHALLEAGLIQASMDGNLIQECKAGLIKLNVANSWIELAMPEPSSIRKLNEAESQQLEEMLGAGPLLQPSSSPSLLVDVGPRWIVAQLADANAVLAAQPDFERIKVLSEQVAATGITIFGEWKASHVDEDVGHQVAASRIEVRSFAPLHGVPEDPVCGSGCGAVGLFIQRSGQRVHFGGKDGQQPLTLMASQGRTLGRDGQVRITLVDMGNGQTEEVRVGGQAVTCIDGQLML